MILCVATQRYLAQKKSLNLRRLIILELNISLGQKLVRYLKMVNAYGPFLNENFYKNFAET
ncbi:hypothetical protein BpHYR1_030332 [Brachionus plicatilis]|uniref:Uncharacterized protein n=1 Tax=Brachionus plicatilis TaxID=10195 RepID=A0A3M7RRV6_BRAPC|nr:hypothetical protein BpHYR1_030332 [Brachionus plicatilis]